MFPTSPAPILIGKVLLLPEALGEVLVRAVAENGDDYPRLQLSRHAQRCRYRGSGGDADQDALLASDTLHHLVGILGRRAKVLLGDGGIVDLRDDRARHVLHAL